MGESPAWPPGSRTRFYLICAGVWLYAADMLVTATIAPALVAEIGGVAYINWTLSLYEVGSIIAGAVAAALSRRHGVKRVLLAATLLYTAGCVLAALAPTMPVLLAARLIQGLGGGLLLSLCYVATYEWFPAHWWNRLFGIVAIIWGAGSLLGPLIGGMFAGSLWRDCFWLFGAQAVIVWVLALRLLPADEPARAPPQRWPLLALAILSLATLLINESGITSTPLLAAAGCILGILLLYVAARCDRRAGVRLLPGQLLAVRHPLGAGLMTVFLLAVATTGYWTYGPLILKVLFATDPLISGYILAAESLAWSLATVAVARLPPSAEAPLIRIGVCIVVAGAAGFVWAVPAGSLPGILLCTVMQGGGFGLCWPSIGVRCVRFADEPERALAAASPSTIQRIGYAVGTALCGIAANSSGLANGSGEAISAAAAKAAAFWVFAAFIPVLALACAFLFTHPRAAAR